MTGQSNAGNGTHQPFSLIVPCYNEEQAIGDTIRQIRNALPEPDSYQLIVVDDGSTDRTPEILAALADDDPRLTIVHLERNRGYGSALKAGIRAAEADFIAIADADGTYPIDRILDLVRECESADMVVGARTGEEVSYSPIRRIPKVFLAAYVSWIARTHIPDFNSGLRVFRRDQVLKYFGILPDGFSFTTTLTLAMHNSYRRVRYLPIGYAKRVGKSKIRPIRDTLNFCQLILRTGMYFAPLRVLAPFVLFFGCLTVISFAYDVFVAQNLTDKTVIFLLAAFNTAMLGLLGDMIARRFVD